MEKRIDLDEAKEIMDEHDSTSEIIAELKRCYEEIDELKAWLFAAEKVVMCDSYTFYHSLKELSASE